MNDSINDLEYKKFDDVGSKGKAIQTISPPLTTKVDEVDSDNTYIGKASHGIATSELFWQIMKIAISGTITTITYADGVSTFSKEWDERASYAY